MKSFLRKQSISLKCLVITLLLSFIGQAVALPDVCTMDKVGTSNADSSAGMSDMISVQAKDDMPCHSMTDSMNMTQGADQSTVPEHHQSAMDCCDSPMMADSSCSCPDNGCSGSVPFFSQNIPDSSSYSEHRSYYAQPRFPNQISSALFRPPIA
jgi:hypothetical protein